MHRYDMEMHIHRLLVSLRCDPDVARVQEDYDLSHPEARLPQAGLPGSHPLKLLPYLPEGIQLLNTYECVSHSQPVVPF